MGLDVLDVYYYIVLFPRSLMVLPKRTSQFLVNADNDDLCKCGNVVGTILNHSSWIGQKTDVYRNLVYLRSKPSGDYYRGWHVCDGTDAIFVVC